jgi:mannose-1-phosphate guanylyltransferase/mannose-6-phosphate isomerase
MVSINPVILSGGIGSRLWPLSRAQFPKQLLQLLGPDSLLQSTILRASGENFENPTIVCQENHRFIVAEQVRESGVMGAKILLEPVGRNTAPAVAVAALTIAHKNPQALLLVLPADHAVQDNAAFHQAIAAAIPCAADGKIVTFGIVPSRPETGYGYIQRGIRLTDQAAFGVSRFVEKPSLAKAEEYLAAGDYLWNSGIFLFRADAYLAELQRLEPELLEHCRAAVTQGQADADFFRLHEPAFAACRSVSIDYAVMERTKQAVVVPAPMGWSDIGSWDALWGLSEQDSRNNVIQGNVLQRNSQNSYLRSEGPLVAASGVTDIVVVATRDAVLVCAKNASQDVKAIVEQLEKDGSELHLNLPTVTRPWGSYETLESGPGFQVKHIIVKPGGKLSLQMHHKRAEHWVVISGTAIVTRADQVFTLRETESTFIPLGTRHRLENGGPAPLHLIEVQCGTYLGEDDIVRFEDSYGR